MSASRSRSSAPVLPMSCNFQQSMPPTGRFYSSASPSSQAARHVNPFATSSSSFSSQASSPLFSRSSSPTRINIIRSSPTAPSVRFSFDRSKSPSRSISSVNSRDPIVRQHVTALVRRKTCMCSPTTHPGSFRCSLHKDLPHRPANVSSPSNHLNARRSAMTNSLVRIGTVEGEWVKRALTALIRPSSHQQRRRADFRPRPSQLSKMMKADDL